jgi:hypothetical protein
MIRIRFSPVSVLPEFGITSDGVVSSAFHSRDIATFHQAAIYIQALPYGFNETSDDSMVLFRDGFGTCTVKHGIIARLAQEHGIPVTRCEGFYPLTDRIVTGAGAILDEYGLPYVPRTHCFLKYRDSYVDLTDGNCTGKNIAIESYFKIIPVVPDQSDSEVDALRRSFFAALCAEDQRFAAVGVERILEALKRCSALNAAICTRRPPNSCHPAA